MSTTKEFALSEALTMVSGKLLDPQGMNAAYKVLNFLANTGASKDEFLFTHELLGCWDQCQAIVRAQCPHLATPEVAAKIDEFIAMLHFVKNDYDQHFALVGWIAQMEAAYGSTVTLTADETIVFKPLIPRPGQQIVRVALTLVAFLILGTVDAQAREYSAEYKAILKEAAQRRHQDVARHNYAQQQAVQMVTQGLQMLQRPSDPWNVPRSSYGAYRALPGNRGYRPPIYVPRIPRY